MRMLTDHIVNPANDKLRIAVTDEPGAGGANHLYVVTGFDDSTNPSSPAELGEKPVLNILFQNGPINEHGVNGVTQEVLLAIVADRLRSFQTGLYSCRENEIALTKIDEARMWLRRRTLARMARGVEGTHAVRDAKPTIRELESILQSEPHGDVEILPDGSVRGLDDKPVKLSAER